MTPQSKARIRALNDTLRTTGQGGTILLTRGVQALGENRLQEIIKAMQAFDDFTEENDPHEEHDFGIMTVDSESIYWKIDYYDLGLQGHSPDPSNPQVTSRVLTILLASEY